MKKTIANTMFTTGAALVILAAFLLIFDIEINFARVVLQIFGANIIINIGLFLLHKIEIRHVILEYLIDICYIIAVLAVFGAAFDWYSYVPFWLLIAMAVVIYLFAIRIAISKIKRDTKIINELLQKRKEKDTSIAS